MIQRKLNGVSLSFVDGNLHRLPQTNTNGGDCYTLLQVVTDCYRFPHVATGCSSTFRVGTNDLCSSPTIQFLPNCRYGPRRYWACVTSGNVRYKCGSCNLQEHLASDGKLVQNVRFCHGRAGVISVYMCMSIWPTFSRTLYLSRILSV